MGKHRMVFISVACKFLGKGDITIARDFSEMSEVVHNILRNEINKIGYE